MVNATAKLQIWRAYGIPILALIKSLKLSGTKINITDQITTVTINCSDDFSIKDLANIVRLDNI
ncbi:Uncharacterised protein [Yersinia enterocolitica]|uniref:Uncharacterized protein n=1 Tax=Yersinia enterocolitica TaxID=630 RepID=A0A9P1PT34_YEREN|nr:Uncharacterised protein [Yersinia enterocolitica]SUP70412.1 Uncharacterised protein [Yersinia kristensenii]